MTKADLLLPENGTVGRGGRVEGLQLEHEKMVDDGSIHYLNCVMISEVYTQSAH